MYILTLFQNPIRELFFFRIKLNLSVVSISVLNLPERVKPDPTRPPPVPARTVPVPGSEPGTRVGRVRVDKGRIRFFEENPPYPCPFYPWTRTARTREPVNPDPWAAPWTASCARVSRAVDRDLIPSRSCALRDSNPGSSETRQKLLPLH